MLPSGAEMPTVVLPKIAVVEPDQEQAEPPGRQHGVDHAAIEKTDDRPFDDHADDADDDRRDDQHRQARC